MPVFGYGCAVYVLITTSGHDLMTRWVVNCHVRWQNVLVEISNRKSHSPLRRNVCYTSDPPLPPNHSSPFPLLSHIFPTSLSVFYNLCCLFRPSVTPLASWPLRPPPWLADSRHVMDGWGTRPLRWRSVLVQISHPAALTWVTTTPLFLSPFPTSYTFVSVLRFFPSLQSSRQKSRSPLKRNVCCTDIIFLIVFVAFVAGMVSTPRF